MSFRGCKVYAGMITRLGEEDLSAVERDSILRKLLQMNSALLHGPTIVPPAPSVPHRYYHNETYENINGQVRNMIDSIHLVDPSRDLRERLQDISRVSEILDNDFWQKLKLVD